MLSGIRTQNWLWWKGSLHVSWEVWVRANSDVEGEESTGIQTGKLIKKNNFMSRKTNVTMKLACCNSTKSRFPKKPVSLQKFGFLIMLHSTARLRVYRLCQETDLHHSLRCSGAIKHWVFFRKWLHKWALSEYIFFTVFVVFCALWSALLQKDKSTTLAQSSNFIHVYMSHAFGDWDQSIK